jgi:hypothetical protein
MSKKIKNADIDKEYGKVTAMKIQRLNEDTKTLETVYFPQFEVIKYKPSTGNTISETFVCISDDKTQSGVVECDTELEALQIAMKFRDNL